STFCASCGERLSELVRVAGLIRCREAAAREPVADRCERGLDRDAFDGCLQRPVGSELAHEIRSALARLELRFARIEMQDAALELVVFDAGSCAQLAQRRAAIDAESQQLRRVRVVSSRQTLGEKLQAPEPLLRIGAQAEKEQI